jgi:hypothetical protein
MLVIIVDSTVQHAALRAVAKKVKLLLEEREWNCFLSLRDPTGLPARSGHSTKQNALLKPERAATIIKYQQTSMHPVRE